jgi:FkbM family methyltransferase
LKDTDMTIKPFPSKANLLQRLSALHLPITEVIDVGVRESTPELMKAFPGKKHHLFEPANLFFPDIRRNYAAFDYVLHEMALSDVNETKYLVVTALNKDGVATHSAMNDHPVPVDGRFVLSCTELPVRRFDSVEVPFAQNSLLKVDVDGADLKVLKGFDKRLSLCSVVIVEMTYHTFSELSNFLLSHNFKFFDFVDLVYYGAGLYQFDGAFVRADLVDELIRPDVSNFQPDIWQSIC